MKKFLISLVLVSMVLVTSAANAYWPPWRARWEPQEVATQQPQNALPGCCAPAGAMATPAVVPAPVTPVVEPAPMPQPNVIEPKPEKTSLRIWTDSTGKYSLEAKFISFQNGIVRLQKTDGKYCRIEMQLLSSDDKVVVQLENQANQFVVR